MAGVIEETGDQVTSFQAGDEVYGMVGGVAGMPGTSAEFVVADADLLARKPTNLSMREAAGEGWCRQSYRNSVICSRWGRSIPPGSAAGGNSGYPMDRPDATSPLRKAVLFARRFLLHFLRSVAICDPRVVNSHI